MASASSRFVIFPEPGRVVVEEEPAPDPQPGEVRIRTHFSLISAGTELRVLHRRFTERATTSQFTRYPHRPGYSLAGAVDAVGEGVTRFRVGDRVAARGKHASLTCVEIDRCCLIPENVADESAAFIGLAIIAQVGILQDEIGPADRCAVVGLGVLGQLVVRFLRALGVAEIVAIDPHPHRLDAALLGGVTSVESARLDDGSAFEQRFDVVFDVTGIASVFVAAQRTLAPYGRLVLLGSAADPARQHLTAQFMTNGLRVIGAHDRLCKTPDAHRHGLSQIELGRAFLDLLARCETDVIGLISHRIAGDRAPEAYDLLSSRQEPTLGVLLDWIDS